MEPTQSADEGLHMPNCINISEAGLSCSPRLKENTTENGIKRKAHVTFGATLLKTVSLFTLLCNVKDSLPFMPMQDGSEDFILTDEGDVNKFLVIDITQNEYYSFELSQPFLIDRLLFFLGLCNNEYQTDANKSATPVAKGLLHRDLASKPRKFSWKYRTAVGMLSYLQGHTQPDISMAVHQTACFCNDPRLSHEQDIMRLGRYLIGTQTRGIVQLTRTNSLA